MPMRERRGAPLVTKQGGAPTRFVATYERTHVLTYERPHSLRAYWWCSLTNLLCSLTHLPLLLTCGDEEESEQQAAEGCDICLDLEAELGLRQKDTRQELAQGKKAHTRVSGGVTCLGPCRLARRVGGPWGWRPVGLEARGVGGLCGIPLQVCRSGRGRG